MGDTIKLSASLEDYLETIYHIISEKEVARAKEIASRLKVRRSSVTEALRSLSQKGFINYAPYEAITLTEQGRKIAEDVTQRHRALKDFFIKVLAVQDTVAEDGACRVEHTAPREIIDRLRMFVNFIEDWPSVGKKLLKDFNSYCDSKEIRGKKWLKDNSASVEK